MTRDPTSGRPPDVMVTFLLPRSVREDSLVVPGIIDAELVGPDTEINDLDVDVVELFQRSTGVMIESDDPKA